MNLHNAKAGSFQVAIQEYNGKFFFVGSVPMELLYKSTNAIGQTIYKSNMYNSKAEAEKALKEVLK